jgi:DNA-binding SARP family transcriptional activator
LWHLPQGWTSLNGNEIILDADCDLRQAHAVAARALNGGTLSFDEIELLSNDILPGWHEEWVMPAQDNFHSLRVQALEAACRSLVVEGSHALAIQAGAAGVAAEPLRESGAEALIEAHLAQGNRYAALQCFQSLAKQLSEELGVVPEPGLTARMNAISRAKSAA